jgi:electron transport complex, RnfABCDGE type, D subunit
MKQNYVVSTSPHVTSHRTTKQIMIDVIIALVPALIASVLLYGFYPLLVCLLSVGSAVLGEFIYNKARKHESTLGDCSAVVTGLIFGLNLPPVLPLYIPIIGGVFATLLVKMLFGGIGKNFANPAITARIFVMLAWTVPMTKYVAPIDLNAGFSEMFKYFSFMNPEKLDTISTATPLIALKNGVVDVKFIDMFFGRIGGSAGEVSALALLIGGVYLVCRKVIDWKIPVIYIATYFLFTLILFKNAETALYGVFCGGLLFGAIFMATDYATSPNTAIGVSVYAFGCGLLTAIFRKFGAMPEGVSFAILLMNIVTPLLDKYIQPKPFGYVKPENPRREQRRCRHNEGYRKNRYRIEYYCYYRWCTFRLRQQRDLSHPRRKAATQPCQGLRWCKRLRNR